MLHETGVKIGASKYGSKDNASDPYTKGGRSIEEWEDDDLTLSELKLKLEQFIEGHEDASLIAQVKADIAKREGR